VHAIPCDVYGNASSITSVLDARYVITTVGKVGESVISTIYAVDFYLVKWTKAKRKFN